MAKYVSIKEALESLYEGDTLQRFKENFAEERKRFSWEAMADCLTEVYEMTK